MNEFSSIFRAYDIRGVVDIDFTPAWVERLGKTCGTAFLEAGQQRAVVGRDCRLSSPEYYDALVSGLTLAGVDVVGLGMVPTPVLYFAVKYLGLRAGIEVTASHNPAHYNGFKIWLGETTLFEDGIQNLRRIMDEGIFATGAGLRSNLDISEAYIEDIVGRLGPCKPFKVVLDAGNGAAGPTGVEVLRRLGAEVIPLYCEPDGAFPNHHPDPTKEENLEDLHRKILSVKADLGVGLDGDGDRLSVMDSQGRLLHGDELLAVYARDLLTRHPGALVLGDVKCSARLFEDIRQRGGVPEMCRTEHSVVKACLQAVGGLLAGELSGHIFIAENWYGFDDAIYSAARFLAILSRWAEPGNGVLAGLPGWPPAWNTPELQIPCPDEVKFMVVSQAQDWFTAKYPTSLIDGARVTFPHGWGLVRASNTTPNLVLRFEADSPECLAQIRAEMEGKVLEMVAAAQQ